MEKKRSLGTRIVGGLLRLHGRLPLAYHHALAKCIAWLLKDVFRYRNDVVLVNMSRSFPEKTYEEIAAIRDRFYRYFARTVTEMVWFGACRGEKGRERLRRSHLVEITNPEDLNRLYANAPQLMVLQAHTGNWELIGGFREYAYKERLILSPEAFAVTYIAQHSALLDAVMAENRTAPVADLGFQGYVETSQVLRFVLERKDRKFGYSFITDQFPYLSMGKKAEVEFMGRRTVTMTGGAALACRMDMAVAYLRFACREDGKGYEMTFVPIAEHAASMTPEAVMERYYQLLEEDLRAQPWNYLWTHKRWKQQ